MKTAKDLTFLTQVLDYKAAVEEVEQLLSQQREQVRDDVMTMIDGHYDNPNLAGELEDYFGITFQEWEKI